MCTGQVSYLGLEGGGNVVVALTNGPTIHSMCNIVNQGEYTVAPAVCKTMYATLLAAKLTERQVTIYYADNGYTCNTFPNWGIVKNTYFVEGPM